VIQALGRALGLDGFDAVYDVRAVSMALGRRVPAFAGIDIDTVGDQGLPLRRSQPPRSGDVAAPPHGPAAEGAETP